MDANEDTTLKKMEHLFNKNMAKPSWKDMHDLRAGDAEFIFVPR